MFDFLRKKLEEAVAQINPFDNGQTAATVRANRDKPAPARTISKQNQPAPLNYNFGTQQVTRNQAQPMKPFNTGVGTLSAPVYKTIRPQTTPKPQTLDQPQVQAPRITQAPTKPFNTGVETLNAPRVVPTRQQQATNPGRQLQDISNLVAGSNEKFLGGAVRGVANTVNLLGTGFNQKEADRRTTNFLRTIGQVNQQGNAPLAQGVDRNSAAFNVGRNIGTAQSIATDIATTAVPGAAAEKALRAAPIARNLGNVMRGGRAISRAVPIVGGGVVSSGINQVKDPTQNAGQNFATGAAFDVASSLIGPGASAAARYLRRPNPAREVGSLPNYTERPISAQRIPALPAQTQGKIRPTPSLGETPQAYSGSSVGSSRLLSSPPVSIGDERQALAVTKSIRGTALPELPINRSSAPTGQAPIVNQIDSSYLDNTPLPTFNTKKVGNLDKAFRSTRSVIERQGESGKELAQALQASRDTQELYLGELQKMMPTVTQLARKGRNALVNKDFENFINATQGLASPKNAKVAQAVQEWQATHPRIRERAVSAGLDVGDLGPNYYPHFIDYDKVFKDKNTYNEAVNHIIKTGQAQTPEEAIKLLGYARDVSRNREFGNLEASRLVDLPFYDKTPNSLISYLTGSTKRIAHTETFGQKDEKALRLVSKIGQEGGDTEAAKNAFDVAVGAKKYNQSTESASRNIRKYITTTRLGLGALTNTSQSVNTGIVTGHLRTLGAMLKQFDPKTREFVGDTGVISDALLNDLRTQKGVESFSQKVWGKVLNKITAPGFGAVEKFNRSVAATAGRDYALRLAQKGDIATLQKLGVTGNIEGKTLTEAQQIQAARKIVEKTQFKVDPQDLPGWVDSPGGKLVSQFRTFSYNQGKFFSNEILKPAARGNLMPLGRMLAALPLGYALYETRRAIDGRPEDEDKLKVGLQSFSKIGGAGLALDIYQGLNPVGGKYLPSDRRVTMATGALGGPAVGQAASLVGGLSEAAQQKNVPEDESRLEGKVALRTAEDKYNDFTPISRFGLQQVPIVGTATANRALPYKKESDADNGKTGSSTADAINSANKETKEKGRQLREAVGKETYDISILSEPEKQKLMDDGVLTQDRIDQAEQAVKDKRIELGLTASKKKKTYADEYKEAQKEFEKNSSKWSTVERAKKQKDLNYLAVKKDFDNDTVDLYSMSKADVYKLVSADPDGNKRVENILAYGDALVKAGLTKTNKYRDKYGNVKLDDGTKRASGGRRTSSTKGKGSRGGRGKVSKGKFDYKLFGFDSNPSKNNTQLRALLKKATLKRTKKHEFVV